MLPSFQYLKAETIHQAVEYLAANEGAKLVAGGTDLLLQMKRGKITPARLVSIKGISELGIIREEQDCYIIGANVTHRQAEMSGLIKARLCALHDAVTQVGSVQIRNTATIVGNICNAAPSADTAGPLLVLNAKVKAVGVSGTRIIELKDFFVGPGETVLNTDEIVTEIIIDKLPMYSGSAYIKFSRRKAMDLSMLGVAVSITSSDKKWIEDIKIALGTAAPTPIRAYEAEKTLKGAEISETVLEKAARVAMKEAQPRTSWRSTAEYRREMIKVLVPRVINKALERISL